MKRTDLPQEFQLLLRHMPYVTIASVCPDGTAWNTPLVGYFDEDLNLYWSSDTSSQHSLNVAKNSSVFVVAYDTSLPLGKGVALYLELLAHVLTQSKEIEAAKKIYLDRFGEDAPGHRPFIGNCPRRIYVAKPIRVSYNTDGERDQHFVDARKQLLTATA